MKKIIPALAVVVLILCVAAAVVNLSGAPVNEEFIRLHIRANSDEGFCQQVKYQVRGSIVTALSGAAGQAENFAQMHAFLNSQLHQIERVANSRLAGAGVNYTATARIAKEEFPARMYNGVLLGSGYYYALIIELGQGTGNNWWCVIYPQLCFIPVHQTDSGDLVYRSIFLQLFANR